jgi:hypothetical protein
LRFYFIPGIGQVLDYFTRAYYLSVLSDFTLVPEFEGLHQRKSHLRKNISFYDLAKFHFLLAEVPCAAWDTG